MAFGKPDGTGVLELDMLLIAAVLLVVSSRDADNISEHFLSCAAEGLLL